MLLHRIAPLLLSLASLTSSAPLTCEQLTRPADQLDPGRLQGTWALIDGSISYLPYLEKFSKRDSASINFPSNKGETNTSYSRGFRIEDKCQYSSSNITLNGSRFTFDGMPASNSSSVFCPDLLSRLSDHELYCGIRKQDPLLPVQSKKRTGAERDSGVQGADAMSSNATTNHLGSHQKALPLA
ncbi:hypothetical protein NQD34_000090 [Periophthalmus magnuspinnatus]|nr:hypothetical protein NQD34_000090 [Periophthalmus magnuspinnatus]